MVMAVVLTIQPDEFDGRPRAIASDPFLKGNQHPTVFIIKEIIGPEGVVNSLEEKVVGTITGGNLLG